MRAPKVSYNRVMGRRVLLAMLAALAAMALGCDTGGLLLVDGNTDVEPSKPVKAPVNELTNAGTLAKNGKYKLVYTLGEPSPQGAVASPNNKLHGGVVGASQTK